MDITRSIDAGLKELKKGGTANILFSKFVSGMEIGRFVQELRRRTKDDLQKKLRIEFDRVPYEVTCTAVNIKATIC